MKRIPERQSSPVTRKQQGNSHAQALRWATVLVLIVLFIVQSFPVIVNAHPGDQRLGKNAAATQKVEKTAPSRASKLTDAALLSSVEQRLLAVVQKQSARHSAKMSKYVWPPQITVDADSDINAYAYIERQSGRPVPDRQTGKFLPHVGVTQPIMKELIEGSADRLAFVVGHEIGHLLLGHVLDTSPASQARTSTLAVIFTADQEHDADILGMQLALEAGYSIKGAREVWNRIMSDDFKRRNPGWDYTSFEGRAADHPAWTDRLALIDKEKEVLWKAMSAFENGVFFLTVQQYPTAEESFEAVTTDFPTSYEAWANLGYARLMMYFDAFDENDIARFGVGQIAVGSFYVRPDSMKSSTKGVDEAMWKKAKEALEKALQLNPKLALAKANLGLIYLFHPRSKDTATAAANLEEAVSLLSTDTTVSDISRIAVVNNAAVALLATGQVARASARLDQAGNSRVSDVQGTQDKMNAVVVEAIPALLYNRAVLLSNSSSPDKKKEAAAMMMKYLENISPSSLWWKSAYARYARSCSESSQACLKEDDLKQRAIINAPLRQVTSVDLSDGKRITLAEPIERVRLKLGKTQEIPIAEGTTLTQLIYPRYGVDILATRRVNAIFLRDSKLAAQRSGLRAGETAPTVTTIKVRSRGLQSKVWVLKVGMPASEIKAVLGSYADEQILFNRNIPYYFYPEVGIAIAYNGNTVTELVVTEIVAER